MYLALVLILIVTLRCKGLAGLNTEISMKIWMPAGDKDEAGAYTNTEDIDCEVCKGDLHLWAVVSPACPGQATCPEHVSALESPNDTLRLLYRCLLITTCCPEGFMSVFPNFGTLH
jgi:hypothetical protein